MKVSEIANILEKWAPCSVAENFDNVGLLIGSLDEEVQGVLITLDCLETIVEEAILKKCNLIITFHPIIFSGLKSITGKNYVEKSILKAIKNNIAIYAIHTNLDIAKEGVNFEIAQRLGLFNLSPLIPLKQCIKKLQVYVPIRNAPQLRSALFQAGAGEIGEYKNCSFNVDGIGTFIPSNNSQPFIGKIGEFEKVKETSLSVIFEDYKKDRILKALKEAHPYEEIAYEVYTLENENQFLGMGKIGYLEKPMKEEDFLAFLKEKLPTKCIRHTQLRNKEIYKVAVLGGSGSFAITEAIKQRADIFITADIKYHDFFKAENKLILADIGHYESEQFTKELLANFLTLKINIPLFISKIDTNPVLYFTN